MPSKHLIVTGSLVCITGFVLAVTGHSMLQMAGVAMFFMGFFAVAVGRLISRD